MAEYRIALSATKGTWVENEAYAELTAQVRTRRKETPIPQGQFVVFDPGGHRREINTRGHASLVLKFPTSRIQKYTASMELDPEVNDEVEVVIPERPKEEKRNPAKLSVVFYGPDGLQTLVISVSDEAGLLIPKFKGNIITDLEGVKPFETKDDGIAKYQLWFSEDDRSVEVRVGDAKELTWRGLMLGGDSKQMTLPETI